MRLPPQILTLIRLRSFTQQAKPSESLALLTEMLPEPSLTSQDLIKALGIAASASYLATQETHTSEVRSAGSR